MWARLLNRTRRCTTRASRWPSLEVHSVADGNGVGNRAIRAWMGESGHVCTCEPSAQRVASTTSTSQYSTKGLQSAQPRCKERPIMTN